MLVVWGISYAHLALKTKRKLVHNYYTVKIPAGGRQFATTLYGQMNEQQFVKSSPLGGGGTFY